MGALNSVVYGGDDIRKIVEACGYSITDIHTATLYTRMGSPRSVDGDTSVVMLYSDKYPYIGFPEEDFYYSCVMPMYKVLEMDGNTILPVTCLRSGLENRILGRLNHAFAIIMDEDITPAMDTISKIRGDRNMALLNAKNPITIIADFAKWALDQIKD